MLLDRLYQPAEREILYHYCSSEAFLAICKSKKLRFSDVFSMNDYLEMHWGYHIWELAAGELLQEVGKDFLDEVDKYLHISGMLGLPVVSCLSMKGDVLSQWRAYAEDGKGYAIGFRARQITQLPVRPLRVLYDKDEQIKEIKTTVKIIHHAKTNDELKELGSFSEACLLLAYDLLALKNPAFFEEQEIRLIHLLDFEKSGSAARLVDKGGVAFGSEVSGEPVSFMMRGNTPAAFIDIPLSKNMDECSIAEVVVGPRNDARTPGVSVFLETIGISSVEVRKSAASYR